MSPTGRRFAAAAAAGMIGLAGLAGLALLAHPGRVDSASASHPVFYSFAGQEKTVDLSSVESAAEYRTDEPEGPGFLGSDAAVLN
ncbi:MAG: hypothetical protein NTX99_05405, partial [Candidatus Aminicenantes bacterium]|nr:hypothetical protein [Candidatus Aminicenantes bacterium]